MSKKTVTDQDSSDRVTTTVLRKALVDQEETKTINFKIASKIIFVNPLQQDNTVYIEVSYKQQQAVALFVYEYPF